MNGGVGTSGSRDERQLARREPGPSRVSESSSLRSRSTLDREALLAFRAEHWQHIRTTNPIESVFAIRSKGCLSHKTALAMVFKLVTAASKTWRRLNGYEKLPRVIQGVKFTDGIQADETETRAAA